MYSHTESDGIEVVYARVVLWGTLYTCEHTEHHTTWTVSIGLTEVTDMVKTENYNDDDRRFLTATTAVQCVEARRC